MSAAAYNIWIGGSSVWVAADQGGSVVRVSPASNRVVARIEAGDGPASMAFDGETAWVVNHRDTTIDRIDLATNESSLLTTLGGVDDRAPERITFSHGSLWVTGRGTDLLKVNPATGAVEQTIEIDASGIDLVAVGDDLWVPTRSDEVDQSGFPTMDALKRVSMSTGAVTTAARPTKSAGRERPRRGRRRGSIADNRSGRLYRVSARQDAGGLMSGIDLALRVVERYLGSDGAVRPRAVSSTRTAPDRRASTDLTYARAAMGRRQLANGVALAAVVLVASASAGAVPLDRTIGVLNREGLDAKDNANLGAVPDTTAAIGRRHYLEAVNSRIALFDPKTLKLVHDRDHYAFWGRAPTSGAIEDPQVVWDDGARRWYYAALSTGAAGNRLLLAWTRRRSCRPGTVVVPDVHPKREVHR